MRSRRTLILIAGLMALVAAGVARASTAPKIHGGLYGAHESLVLRHKSAAVNVIVVDHSQRIIDAGVACNSPKNPIEGLDPDTTLVVRLPHALTITRGGSFSFSGQVTLTPEETQSGISAKSQVSMRGKFVLNKTIVRNKTIALTGTISASVCSPSTPKTYSLIWIRPPPPPRVHRPARLARPS
jgi:hypothetical protein